MWLNAGAGKEGLESIYINIYKRADKGAGSRGVFGMELLVKKYERTRMEKKKERKKERRKKEKKNERKKERQKKRKKE